MAEYGYIRVSSKEQNEARQLDALHEVGVTNIYIDKQSGKDFNRPEYTRMTRKLKRGDVLYIKSIDRLGRNYEEIQNQWRALTKDKGADIVVIDMPLLDTRSDKNLIGVFVSDIVLQLLAFVAENERVNIRQRQAEGIAAAKARGVHLGRPKPTLPDEFDTLSALVAHGVLSQSDAAKQLGMPLSTFRYHYKERAEQYAT